MALVLFRLLIDVTIIFYTTTLAVPTLIDLPDEVCFGKTYQIYCSHPPLGGSSGYLPTVFWNRNRTELIPDGTTEQSVVPINSTVTGLQINITKGVHETGTYYMCYVLKRFNATFFSTLESNDVTVNPTTVIANVPYQFQSVLRATSVTLSWSYEEVKCYKDIFFNITHCLLVNGAPDPSQCTSYTTTNMTITVESLTPSTSYIFMIRAQSIQYPDIISVTVEVNATTIKTPTLSVSHNLICYDRQVQLTCHHHDITDTTSSGPIFNQTSPVVWMKDGERIDLPDTYHMISASDNTETILSITTQKCPFEFLNGEANYSCAVVYADGSMEESEPVTISEDLDLELRSDQVNVSIKPLCTIIFLMWSHSDEYLENCTFMCGLTCPQNGDEPNITENLKYLFIGESYDRTVNFFCAMDYTCTQIDQGTCTYNDCTTTTNPSPSDESYLPFPYVIGTTVGGTVFLVLLGIMTTVALFMRKRRIRHNATNTMEQENVYQNPTTGNSEKQTNKIQIQDSIVYYADLQFLPEEERPRHVQNDNLNVDYSKCIAAL